MAWKTVWVRRGAALFLCVGLWVVAAFLIFDTAGRWWGEREGEHPISAVLVFPISLLALVAALALTVWVGRKWASLGQSAGGPGPR